MRADRPEERILELGLSRRSSRTRSRSRRPRAPRRLEEQTCRGSPLLEVELRVFGELGERASASTRARAARWREQSHRTRSPRRAATRVPAALELRITELEPSPSGCAGRGLDRGLKSARDAWPRRRRARSLRSRRPSPRWSPSRGPPRVGHGDGRMERDEPSPSPPRSTLQEVACARASPIQLVARASVRDPRGEAALERTTVWDLDPPRPRADWARQEHRAHRRQARRAPRGANIAVDGRDDRRPRRQPSSTTSSSTSGSRAAARDSEGPAPRAPSANMALEAV